MLPCSLSFIASMMQLLPNIKYLQQVATVDVADAIEAAKDVLRPAYGDIMSIFSYYSSIGSGNAFAMQVVFQRS